MYVKHDIPTNKLCVSILQLCAWALNGWKKAKLALKYSDKLQLGEPAAGQINGRKKVKIALETFEQVTCRASKAHERCWLCHSNYTCPCIAAVCMGWVWYTPGVRQTWQNITEMVSFHTNCLIEKDLFTTEQEKVSLTLFIGTPARHLGWEQQRSTSDKLREVAQHQHAWSLAHFTSSHGRRVKYIQMSCLHSNVKSWGRLLGRVKVVCSWEPSKLLASSYEANPEQGANSHVSTKQLRGNPHSLEVLCMQKYTCTLQDLLCTILPFCMF